MALVVMRARDGTLTAIEIEERHQVRYEEIRLWADPYKDRVQDIKEISFDSPKTVVGELRFDFLIGVDEPAPLELEVNEDDDAISTEPHLVGWAHLHKSEETTIEIPPPPGSSPGHPPTVVTSSRAPVFGVDQSERLDLNVTAPGGGEIRVPGDFDWVETSVTRIVREEDGAKRSYTPIGRSSSVAASGVISLTCQLTAYSAIAGASMLLRIYETDTEHPEIEFDSERWGIGP